VAAGTEQERALDGEREPDEGMDQPAVFELFFRELPRGRDFAVAAGLDDALAFLEHARFTDAELDYLRAREQPEGRRLFDDVFLESLRGFRFEGEKKVRYAKKSGEAL